MLEPQPCRDQASPCQMRMHVIHLGDIVRPIRPIIAPSMECVDDQFAARHRHHGSQLMLQTCLLIQQVYCVLFEKFLGIVFVGGNEAGEWVLVERLYSLIVRPKIARNKLTKGFDL